MKKSVGKKRGFLDGYKTYDTSGGYGSAREWREAFYQRMSKEDAAEALKDLAETPYEILGVAPSASQDEIKSAFRKKIMEWHPDHNQHRLGEIEAMTRKILAAWSLLSDE